MIIGIVGDIGSGKTLSMTHLGMIMQKSGISIYSNYHLEFPHVRIDNIQDINSINTPTNALLFDEIWITADSRKSMQYENIMLSTSVLQSRKKHIDILYTTQYIAQVDTRIRDVTNFIFHPTILVTDSAHAPMYIRLKVLKRNLYGDMIESKHIDLYTYGTEELYNTDELVTKSTANKYKPFLKKYKDFSGKKSQLMSCMIIDDGLTKSDADIIANYILQKT